jgi:hypothetical protein
MTKILPTTAGVKCVLMHPLPHVGCGKPTEQKDELTIMTAREKIAMGECQSPLTVDRCPYCCDTCDASQANRRYKDLITETVNPILKKGKVRCIICETDWVTEYPSNLKKLKCPNCKILVSFIEIE